MLFFDDWKKLNFTFEMSQRRMRLRFEDFNSEAVENLTASSSLMKRVMIVPPYLIASEAELTCYGNLKLMWIMYNTVYLYIAGLIIYKVDINN